MVSNVSSFRFRLRHDTAANWSALNPVLSFGEPGIELDTHTMKVGDGVTAWNALAYIAGGGGGGGGTVSYTNVTGLAEYIRDTMAAALIEGTGIDIVNNDAGDTITITATGGGGGGSSSWNSLTDMPAFIGAGASAAAARTAIGAGTSNLAIGTSAVTAKAGDYQPTAANISDSTTVGRSLITAADSAAVRSAAGLSAAQNTADADKPVSIATTAALALKTNLKNATRALTSMANDYVERVTVTDDGTSQTNWPDRWSVDWVSSAVTRRVFALGKKGEVKIAPADQNTTPFTLYTKNLDADTDMAADLIKVDEQKDVSVLLWRMTKTAAQFFRRSNVDIEARILTDFTGTLATSSQNFMEHRIAGVLKMWHNEWGAIRGTSPYTWGDALLRAIRTTGDGIVGGAFLELEDRRVSPNVKMFQIGWDGQVYVNGVAVCLTYVCAAGETKDSDPNVAKLPSNTVLAERLS